MQAQRDNTSTFVRVDIRVASVEGVPSGTYLFRLTDDGKTKSTSTKQITPGVGTSAFSEKLRIYSKVNSRGQIIDDKTSSPMLSLVRAEGISGEVLISKVKVRLGDLLQARSGKNAKIDLGKGMLATLNLSVKEMGGSTGSAFPALASSSTHEDDFSDLEVPSSAPSTPTTSQGGSGVVVASVVQQQTRSIERSSVGPGMDYDARALKVKVERLELEKRRLQKERADAVKKVQAHVAHASKIKTTYNQLAAMYNSLRQEHVELRKSNPRGSGVSLSDVPAAAMTTGGSDASQLQEENESLRKEVVSLRSEKDEIATKSHGLVESKAKTLADLEARWRETQDDLKTTKANLQAEHERNEQMRAELERVKSSAGDVSELKTKLELVVREKTELEDAHQTQLVQINRDVADKSLQISRLQVAADNAFRSQEESRKELDDMKAALDNAARNLDAQNDVHAKELSVRNAELQSLRDEVERSKEKVVNGTRSSSDLEARNTQLQKDLEMARKQADDIGQALHHARAELNEKEKILSQSRGEMRHRRSRSDSIGKSRSFVGSENAEDNDWQRQIEELKEERDQAMRELFRVRKGLNKEVRELKKRVSDTERSPDRGLGTDSSTSEALNVQISTLKSDNEQLQARLTEMERESTAYRSQLESSAAKVAASEKEAQARLEQVKLALQAKTEEVETLTLTVSKIQKQDDQAKRELMEMSQSRSQKEGELMEEVARLEKEVKSARASSVQVEQDRSQLDMSIASLNAEVEDLKRNERKMADEMESSRKLLAEKRSQLESRTAEVNDLQLRISTLTQQSDDATLALKSVKESTKSEYSDLQAELDVLQAKLKDAEGEVGALQEERDALNTNYSGLQEKAELLKQDKGKQDMEVGRLSAELSSLKQSLNQASQTSTTVEKQLSEAQTKLAERNAELSARSMELESNMDELTSTKKLLEEVNVKLQTESRRAQEVDRLETLLETSKNSLANEKKVRVAKESELIEYESSLDALQSESKALNAKVTTLSGQLHGELLHRQEAEDEAKRLEETLREGDNRLRSLEGDLMESKRAAEEARNANESLKLRLDQVSLDLEQRQRELSEVKNSMNSSARELSDNSSKLESEISALKAAAREEERTRRGLEEQCTALEYAAQEADDLRERLASKEVEFAKLTKLLGGLKDENEKTLSDYEILREQNRNMKRQLEDVEDISHSVEEERDRMTSDSQNVRRELERVVEEKEVLAATVEELQKSLARDEKDRKKSTELRKELRAARGRAEMLEADIANMKAENRELASRAEAAKALEDANGEMDGIVEDLVKAKLRLAEAHERNDALKFRLNKLEALSHANNGSSSFERKGSSSFERKSSSEKRAKRGLLR